MQLFVILLSLSLLGAIGLSFKFAKTPKKIVPIRDRFTGYPTWQGEIEGFDPNRLDGMSIAANALMLVAGIIGLKSIRNPPAKSRLITHFFTVSDDSDRDPTGEPAFGFNCLLVLYIWVTLIALVASIFINVGKLWVVLGVFHNSSEILILVLLGSGGKITNSSFLAWMLFYVLSAVTPCIFADFPADAFFFKFQGLCMDFALAIEFVRIYIATKEHIREAGRDTLPLTDDDVNDDNNGDVLRRQCIRPATINHPNQLIVLIAASSVHLVGNILNTFYSSRFIPLLLFFITYAITFPLYAYYVYLDTNAASVLPQKRIYLPSTPTWKVFIIAMLSIAGPLLTVRIALGLQ